MSETTSKTSTETCCSGAETIPAKPAAAAPSCCAPAPEATASCCDTDTQKPGWRSIDWLMWVSGAIILVAFIAHYLFPDVSHSVAPAHDFVMTVVEMMNMMWWGLALGIFMMAILGQVPREFVMSALGTGTGVKGTARAVAAGVLLDLCNHGILMVAARFYERGASTGQVMAFLVASPWNSLSLTIILVALIGLPWTLGYIALSMVIAMVTGLAFEWLQSRGTLPKNPNTQDLPEDFRFWPEAKRGLAALKPDARWFFNMAIDGIKSSRMIIRWILFGVVLAGLIRAVTTPEQFGTYFGPTLLGLALTMLAATVIEVCSEGSVPIAADIVNNADAPGNGFAFLMTGVATDYTEIMVLREATGSWKIPLFLPLISVPQVLLIAWLINQF